MIAGLMIVWAGWAGVVLLAAVPVYAQRNATPAQGVREGLEAPLVAPSHSMRAHGLVEQWIRRGAVPQAGDAEAGEAGADGEAMGEQINVTGLLGVQVTLRLDGIPVGRGEAYRRDAAAVLEPPGPAVDLVSLLRPATVEALAGVRRSLMDAHRRAIMQQIGTEPSDPPSLGDLAGRLLVDVQLAHRVEPIEVPSDAELTAVLGEFAPGYHGLYSPSDHGDPGAAIVWPATALAHHSSPRGQFMRLLDARGRDPQAMLELGRPGGILLLRFEVIHVVRAQLHLPARQLVRGNELLPPRSIDSRTLDGMVSRLARHLHGRFTSRDLIRGTYHPTSNRYDPEVAETRDAGLASYALMRYARHRAAVAARAGRADASIDELASAARASAVLLGRTLLEHTGETQRPAGMALALLTLVDDVDPGAHDELRDALARELLAMYDAEADEFRAIGDQGEQDTVSEGSAAVIVAALAALYEQTREERVGEVVHRQLEALSDQLERRPNVAALPWLSLAHHRAGALLAYDEAGRERLARRERWLGRVVERLVERQVRSQPRLGPSDVIGGYELTPGPAGAPPSPDWRTAHVLGFLALCLREPGIVNDHDAMDWVLSAALAGRFVAQLMMDETSCYYVRSLPEAVGGVRLALWDNRLSVAATAMSLLSSVQLQETLERHGEHLGQ